MSEQNALPPWLACWQSKEEKEKSDGERERWMNRPTFILAAIGSAIGLGNFWRFPYLTYKYGGAYFFFPYCVCLFLMGIPLLLQELSLGQKFQRGDISVFSLSVTILRGCWPWFLKSFLKNLIADFLSRLLVTSTSSSLPSWSTARHRYRSLPLILMKTSSRNHSSPSEPCFFFRDLAKVGVNLRHHCRIDS